MLINIIEYIYSNMKGIDYDRFYEEFDLEFLTSPIGKFNRVEVEQILDNLNIKGIDVKINLYKLRDAMLNSLNKELKANEELKSKLDRLGSQDAYEFIFRATVIDRIKIMQQNNEQ